ncbi:BlaI/MecI/CopY family transcriptional regulator [Prolixibacteraceae bacterium JC049]|nr:BlaI/MecI/CopY family transcriptional regulator [Prolixibacteraceae bacterium JC049]
MQEITKAQEEILRVLWKIKDGAVSDIVAAIPEPKPAYNTVATVIKVLEKKEYVAHKKYGKTYVYYPLVSKKEYGKSIVSHTLKNLYNNSLPQMLSHFMRNKDVSISELEELKATIEQEIEKQKQ